MLLPRSLPYSPFCSPSCPSPPPHTPPTPTPHPPVHISGEAGPEDIFLPILDATLERGTRPDFWEAATQPQLPEEQLPGTFQHPGADHAEHALLAEQVLMLKRAASRLAEMTKAARA